MKTSLRGVAYDHLPGLPPGLSRARFIEPPDAGAGTGAPTGGTGTGDNTGGGGGGGEPRTFTQEELTAIASKEKDQGRRAERSALLEGTGFESIDELRAAAKAAREAEEARLTDAQRREREIEQRETTLAERELANAARAASLARRTALVSVGAIGEDLKDAEALLAARLPVDADEAAITAAVAEVQTRRPELFGAAPAAGRPPAPDARLRGVPPRAPVPLNEKGARGRAEAERRFGDKVK